MLSLKAARNRVVDLRSKVSVKDERGWSLLHQHLDAGFYETSLFLMRDCEFRVDKLACQLIVVCAVREPSFLYESLLRECLSRCCEDPMSPNQKGENLLHLAAGAWKKLLSSCVCMCVRVSFFFFFLFSLKTTQIHSRIPSSYPVLLS